MKMRQDGADLRLRGLFAGAALAAALASPALAQQAATAPAPKPAVAPKPAAAPAPDPMDVETEVEELVVTGARLAPRGSVTSDIPAEVTLGPQEIRSLGASSVAELLDALAPELQSSRGRGGGRPVILVNGGRISGFNEVRDLPPEAIQRVEIFPEEVALAYGYRADQRVMNIVLRRRFRALTAEAGVTAATAGGRTSVDADANALTIQRDNRLQVDVKAGHSSSLTESERDLTARDAGKPFDLIGNVTASPFAATAQIDPRLPVTVAPLPAGLTRPATLQDFTGPARTSDVSPFRTLLPSSDSLSLNAILTRPIKQGVSMTVNGSLDYSQSQSLLGLASSSLTVPAGNPFSPFAGPVEVDRYTLGAGPLQRLNESLAGHLGLSANGAVKGWRWSFTGNADRGQTSSVTDTGLNLAPLQAAVSAGDPSVNPFGALPASRLFYRAPDQAKSIVTSADGELLANGTLFKLPAGDLTAAITGGLATIQSQSESFRAGVSRSADLSRNTGSAQVSFDVPLASRKRGVLSGLGDLSLNVNLAVDHLSDFGDLTTVGGGVHWSPWDKLRLIASFTQEDGAPTIQQLGDPEVATPAVRVFDFTRGETVEVTQITGGNPGLGADNRRVVKLGVNFKPFDSTNLNFRADYTRSRIRDAIAAFPTATPEIEAAFPDRFVRNASGTLVQIDSRPVNFARQDTEELRYGFTFSKPLGPQRPPGGFPGGRGNFQRGGQDGSTPRTNAAPADGAAPTPAPSGQAGSAPAPSGDQAPAGGERRAGGGFDGGGPGGGGGFRGGGGRGGFGGGGGGSLQLSVFHTVRFVNEVLIRPGVPVLDFLNGSAAGNGGGTPRQQVDVQGAVSKNGLGARLNAKWQSGTEVHGGANGDLSFSDLTTVNLRLFADLGQRPIARRHPFLRGSRVTLSFDNLFDARLQVRDAAGVTPISYQPDLLDPLGRTVRLSFRKLFF